jgi:MOSC domain-containing protein YiiM
MRSKGNEQQAMILGKVASLHLHSVLPWERMQDVFSMELVAGKGIAGNRRYFNRPTRRQVTLIEREQLAEHAAMLDLEEIAPGRVRSNIETTGIWFRELIGKRIQIGSSAVLFLYEARIPCHKMEAIAPGLRRLMENGKQGVLAQVIASGVIQTGDAITLANHLPGK